MTGDITPWLGGLAGIVTSLMWAASATLWGMISRSVNAPAISFAATRVVLASVMLMGVHRIFYGSLWPQGVHQDTIMLLAFSSLLSITIGDLGFFYGIKWIGPRLVMLLSSMAPIITTVVAWFTIGEILSWTDLVGIAAVVGGVAWVVSEQGGKESWGGDPKMFRSGILIALSSTILLALSYVVSRAAMNGMHFGDGPPLPKIEPYSAGVIRVVAATVMSWMILPAFGAVRMSITNFVNPRLMPLAILATICGLVVGVWTAMITLKYAPSGVGSALMSLSPIFMLPLTALVFGEKHTARAVVGTIVAVGGAALLLIH
jgi:drug/metabolite transporter (DMT)-like permease